MPTGITDSDWEVLLQRIADKECTPFVGAGASTRTVPLASELARAWAKEYGYPLADGDNLARVAQYLAVEHDPMFPKQLLRRTLQQTSLPDFAAPDDPHGALADLDLPVYLTTNYDGLMFGALEHREKDPRRELCGWNDLVREAQPSLLDDGFAPTPANPLVYHLHGHCEMPQSMVLTEDDYLAFLVRISTDNRVRLLPSRIRSALATTSLLFVGYSLSDWDFRVLFRGLMGSLGSTLGMTSIAVQLDPSGADASEESRVRTQQYLNGYFEQIQTIKVRLYWGDVRDFARELHERWDAFRAHG